MRGSERKHLSQGRDFAREWRFRLRRLKEHPKWKTIVAPSYARIKELVTQVEGLQAMLVEHRSELSFLRQKLYAKKVEFDRRSRGLVRWMRKFAEFLGDKQGPESRMVRRGAYRVRGNALKKPLTQLSQ